MANFAERKSNPSITYGSTVLPANLIYYGVVGGEARQPRCQDICIEEKSGKSWFFTV